MPKIVTEEKKREIKKMLDEGRGIREIMEACHVASKTIAMVKAEMGGGQKSALPASARAPLTLAFAGNAVMISEPSVIC